MDVTQASLGLDEHEKSTVEGVKEDFKTKILFFSLVTLIHNIFWAENIVTYDSMNSRETKLKTEVSRVFKNVLPQLPCETMLPIKINC